LEGGDHSFKTPSGEANGPNSQLLLAYPNAFAAENTFIGIIYKERTTLIYGEVSFEFPESLRLEFDSKMFGNFLKFTGSVF
jgi:hypothetical protein